MHFLVFAVFSISLMKLNPLFCIFCKFSVDEAWLTTAVVGIFGRWDSHQLLAANLPYLPCLKPKFLRPAYPRGGTSVMLLNWVNALRVKFNLTVPALHLLGFDSFLFLWFLGAVAA